MSDGFNLVDRPWIKVQTIDGEPAEVGLRDFFSQWDRFATLDGETPTQNAAVFRVLMAIVVRTVRLHPEWGFIDDEGELWREIYAAGDFPELIANYLETHHGRFDLASDAVPFFQVADLHTSKEVYESAAALVPDTGPGLFSTQTEASASELEPAVAARYLIHRQAYDYSGIKSGIVGDPRVKGGKGYPTGPGWAGRLGHTVVTGPTLRDTFMLSLPMLELIPEELMFDDEDLPPWERQPDTAMPRSDDAVEPNGIVDLLTWQQRRIRLFWSEDAKTVTHVLIGNGDRINERNQFAEPYSPQRYSVAQSKKANTSVFFAQELDPTLTVWRGVQAMFADSSIAETKSRRAPVLKQFTGPVGPEKQTAYAGKHVGVWLCGIEYGPQQSSFSDEMSEVLPIDLSLMTEDGFQMRNTVLDAIKRVFTLRGQLRWFFKQLEVSQGGSPEEAPDAPTQAWLAELEQRFTQWLAQLSAEQSAEESQLNWLRTLRRVTYRTVTKAVDQAGPHAAAGWLEQDPSGSVHFHSSARYESWMLAKLKQAAPLPSDNEQKGGSDDR